MNTIDMNLMVGMLKITILLKQNKTWNKRDRTRKFANKHTNFVLEVFINSYHMYGFLLVVISW